VNHRTDEKGESKSRGSPSHREVDRRRQKERMTCQKRRVERSTGGSW
jgi:hypothetical protein